LARIYEFSDSKRPSDLEGSELKSFDPVTRRALLRFWIAAPGIVVAAAALYFLSRGKMEPAFAIIAALLVALFAMALLFMMNRSLLKMHVVTKAEAGIDKRIDSVLAQLDDRFAVFNGVQIESQWLDHLIVGPSGIYVVKSSATLDKDGWARSGDIEQLLDERDEAIKLLKTLLPQVIYDIEPVLCVPTGSTVAVDQSEKQVWIVPADKMAVALIKRSTAEGAIGRNVNETGAFSTDTLQSAAVERALANHWNIPTRKTRADFEPPPELTQD